MGTVSYGKFKVGVVGRLRVWFISGIFLLVAVSPAAAFRFSLLDDEVTGSLDTTMSYGVGVRTGKPVDKTDLDNITMRDWTFAKGDIYTNNFKVTPELRLKWKNYGLFARVTGYWDTVIDRGSSGRADYPFDQGDGDGWANAAEEEIGLGYDVNDLYLYGSYDVENFLGLGYAPVDLRIGNQVFNWGEGSFYIDGINSTNALDFNKLFLPGSEIKDATIAVPAVLAQVGLFDSLSVDAYYQFGWSESKLPPVGTFFADSSDVFGQGGRQVIVHDGFGGALPVVNRLGDRDAKDDGQWGLGTRYSIGDFELGAYYLRTHSQLPQLQYVVPDVLDPFQYLAENAFRFIYPEDVDMYGASLTTSLSGWAFAAEVAYRPNAVIMTINPNVYLDTQIGNLFVNGPQSSFGAGRLGTVNPGDVIDAYEQRDAWHGQVNMLKELGPSFGFDTTWLFLSAAADHLPGNREGLASNGPDEQSPDAVAWGYSIDIDSTWYNVLPSLSITPGISWMHAVSGYSHIYGNFWEGQKSVQLRINSDYGDRWAFNLNYNRVLNDEKAYAENGTNVNFSASYKF